jgi:hypothetical protein
MRDELEIVKWWVVVGLAAVTFHKLAKIFVNVWNFPQPLKDIFD